MSPIRLYNNLLCLLFYVLLTFAICNATSGSTHTNVLCSESDRDAVLQFKDGIRVDHCGRLDSWRVSQDCCLWDGVECEHHSGQVIRLYFPGNETSYTCCLEGTLGVSLFELKHLKYLDLSFNYFQGQTIPKFSGSLTNLEHLDLSNAGFSGIVPQEIGNLSSLSFLNLNNDLSYGKYNNEMRVESLGWLSQLRLLTYVDMSGIDLSVTTNHWLTVLSSLPFLETLQFDYCELSLNKLPSSLPYNNISSTLSVISLVGNNLNGTTIFEWLFNLTGLDTNLVSLDLSGNDQLFGNSLLLVPRVVNFLGSLCSLQYLGLDSTNLNYDFSEIIGSFSTCVCKTLVSLYLGDNRVWGSIPDNISTFSSLTELYLRDSEMKGTISPMLGQLYTLEMLYLGSNSFKGVLTSAHFSGLSKLSELFLENNIELMVNISDDWNPPFQLTTLFLSSCKVGPDFPKWILTQNNLELLDLSDAGIFDVIPVSFWSSSLLSRIQFLSLSQNMIYGTLPNVLSTIHNDAATVIDLSFNSLEGALPLFLRNNVLTLLLNDNNFSKGLVPFFCSEVKKSLISLKYLSLSNNLFFEELPNCFKYFPQLVTLHLENNNLHGKLPTSIGTLDKLVTLQLRNNSLSGEFPTSLLDCSSLVILDLSHNSLNGYIPPNFGQRYKSLGILNLQNNQFFGSIPPSLCRLFNLQVFDISKNHISGNIPQCVYELKGMGNSDISAQENILNALSLDYTVFGALAYIVDNELVMWKKAEQTFNGENSLGQLIGIDLSDNNLEGQIPQGISSLVGLKFLNLSRNNLSGPIMSRIGQLKSLESLDLSHNHLSDKIPISLSQITTLDVLDLSYNNLSGKIPEGTQLETFNASVYMGNHGLCGAPLRKCDGEEVDITIPQTVDNEHNNTNDFYLGLFISLLLGFIVGFWGVCGTLVIKRSWRHAFFRFYEDGRDKIYVMLVVNVARVWRRS